jgi:diguanylate cyclase (GGDEF)-like protein
VPLASVDDDEGLFSFEERLTAEIENLIAGLDGRVRDCEALAEGVRELEDDLSAGRARIAELEGLLAAEKARSGAAALADGLTGLPNRQEILKAVRQEKNRADRTIPEGQPAFCLILIDLDDFETLNAELGQQSGDRVLKRLAAIIKSSMRSYDYIGRYGADEFLVLVTGADKDQAMRVLREAARKLKSWDGLAKDAARVGKETPTGAPSFCAGLAGYASEGRGGSRDAEAIIAQAEYALHRAKRKGRGSVAAWGEPRDGQGAAKVRPHGR